MRKVNDKFIELSIIIAWPLAVWKIIEIIF